MKSGISLKSIALCFVAVTVFYLGSFHGVEYLRYRKGPWKITFASDDAGRPSLIVAQEHLKIADIRINFPDSTAPRSNVNEQVLFDRAKKPLPFGERLHEDLIVLPGVENLNLFGHQVEIFPRTLRIDGREYPWETTRVVEVQPRVVNTPTNTPAGPPAY